MTNDFNTPWADPGDRLRPADRSDIDWAAVEQDYRAGGLSLRDLARRHGCSHSAIANRAGRLRWERTSGVGLVTKATKPPDPRASAACGR